MECENAGALSRRFGDYHDVWADVYDDWNPQFNEAMIATPADLARGVRAPGLGIGTGRCSVNPSNLR